MSQDKPPTEKQQYAATLESALESWDKVAVWDALLQALDHGNVIIADRLQERYSLLELSETSSNEAIKKHCERRLNELSGIDS